MPRPALTACLLLALGLPTTALATDAPLILRAGNGIVAAPFIPGGSVVSAHYKAVGRPWKDIDIEAGSGITGLAPLAFVEDRVFDDEVWNHPFVAYTATGACVFGLGDGGGGSDASACRITSGDVVIYTGHARYFGLAEGETVEAAATFQLPEALGLLGMALVVRTEAGRELHMVQYDESEWDFINRVVVELPEGLGPELAVQAWCHDGVPRVGIMDDSTWWIGTDPLGFVITGDDGGTWRLDLVANDHFDLDTLRVTQLDGDTAGTQRVTVQDGQQLRWLEFVDPDDAREGAYTIPGDAGNRAFELDADLGLYAVEWLKDAGDWGASIIKGAGEWWVLDFGDTHTDLDPTTYPARLREIDPDLVPDTWWAIGGNAFVNDDPDRPVVLGSTGMTVEASYHAGLVLKGGVSGTTDRVTAGRTAAAQLLVGEQAAAPAVEVTGSQALAVVSGEDRRLDAEALFASYWADPDDIAGLAHFADFAMALLGTDLGGAFDAAAVVEPVSLAGDASLSAVALGDTAGGGSDAIGYTDDDELFDFSVATTLAFNHPGSYNELHLEALAYSGYNGVDGILGHEAVSVATVALGSDDTLGVGSDEHAWSLMTTDPDAPVYDEVRSLLAPFCGGVWALDAVESTSLATRSEIGATYTVRNIAAAGNDGTTRRGFVAWSDGVRVSGNGELDVVVTMIDSATGARTEVLNTSQWWALPEVGDEVLGIIDSGYSLGHQDVQEGLTTGPVTNAFDLELSYSLRSRDGTLVTLSNAVGFGFAMDSDGDGLYDDEDPTPDQPGADAAWLAERTETLALAIEALDLALVDAANDNAASGRRGSLATRAHNAAESFADGKTSAATALLDGLLDRMDGADSPEDWLVDSDERTVLAEAVLELLELAAWE